jgi:peptide/nickel transport system substrate-binding protein
VSQPIPSAGPYYVSAHVGDLEEVVRRNPNYEGPRPHEIDAFVFENGVDTQVLPGRVDGGTADYVWGDGGAFALRGDLDRRFGSPSGVSGDVRTPRYFAPETMAVRYLDFNTKRGVFRDPKLRQAVNYTLDRRALATIFDGAPVADPVPPGLPGTGAPVPYPVDRPNLKRGRALAGRARRDVTLFAETGRDETQTAEAVAVIEKDLARIGMSVRVRRFDDAYSEAAKPNANVDLLLNSWYADYADPSNFVNALFDRLPSGDGYALPYHLYSDRRFLAQMRRAFLVQGARRAPTYRALVGSMMRTSPPSAPFAVPRTPAQFFSGKLGCQVFRPQDYGYVDLAALRLAGES